MVSAGNEIQRRWLFTPPRDCSYPASSDETGKAQAIRQTYLDLGVAAVASPGGLVKAAAENLILAGIPPLSTSDFFILIMVRDFGPSNGTKPGTIDLYAGATSTAVTRPFSTGVLDVTMGAVHDFAFVSGLDRALFAEVPVP